MKTTIKNKLEALEALGKLLSELNKNMQPDGGVHYSVVSTRETVLGQISNVVRSIGEHEDEAPAVPTAVIPGPVEVPSDEEVPF